MRKKRRHLKEELPNWLLQWRRSAADRFHGSFHIRRRPEVSWQPDDRVPPLAPNSISASGGAQQYWPAAQMHRLVPSPIRRSTERKPVNTSKKGDFWPAFPLEKGQDIESRRKWKRSLNVTVTTSINSVLLCFVTSSVLVTLFASASSVLSEPLGLGTDHHLSIQTKQGIFRGVLLSPKVDHWPLGLRSLKMGDHLGDIVVGFLGIKYAGAPIKRLRFMPPTAYSYFNQASNQVHNMQKFGPICMQRFPVDLGSFEPADSSSGSGNWTKEDSMRIQLQLMKKLLPMESFAELEPLVRRLSAFEQSEDCLNLNIYAPLNAFGSRPLNGSGRPHSAWTGNATNGSGAQLGPRTPLPVLVIIHGESFDYGSGSAINALRFVHRTGLIVVTFNFRLNVLGYPPKLAGGSLRTNLGLMDQVAALHWIRDNIQPFGGSPDNITLMGTKRAALAVNLLMLSPLAKDLFQRAIMEDGSALTPLVANHLMAPALAPQHPIGNPTTSPGLLHLRLLARLCDCPVYLGPTSGRGRSSNATVHQATAQHLSSAGALNGATHIETKANSLTIECLRQKPIEQIMQRVPLDLLHFDQMTGDISMPARWLRILAQVLPPTEPNEPSSQLALNASLSSSELKKLISKVAKLQLDTERYRATGNAAQTTNTNSNSAGWSQLDDEVDELFGATFGQPSVSMQSIFGPTMDGTIVPNEDLSQAMLKPSSTFAQSDLLIGLSQPIIVKLDRVLRSSEAINSSDNSSTNEDPLEADIDELKFRPDHFVSERITNHLQQVGLTGERAVEMINVFVRSFYRHHNQEIANSIINHYLNGQSSNERRLKIKKKLSNGEEPRSSARNGTGALADADLNADEHERRMMVLDSVLEMFQDALTSVPVFKTALIHATKQLDLLVEPFIGREFDNWISRESSSDSSQASNDSIRPQFDQRSILESFVKFAKTLFDDPNWPLELRSPDPNSPVSQQPKSTYLYQLDSRPLIEGLQRLTARSNHQPSNKPVWFQRAVSETLGNLLAEISNGYMNHQPAISIGCAVDFDTYNYDSPSDKPSLLARFKEFSCKRMSLIVAHFASTGKLSSLLSASPNPSTENQAPVLAEKIAQYESKCKLLNDQSSSEADHHSVQPAAEFEAPLADTASEPGFIETRTCQSELRALVFAHLIEQLESTGGSDSSLSPGISGQRWTSFNLFSQQVASLLNANEPAWTMSQVSSDDSVSSRSLRREAKSTILARSSFWLNFIPALNCTKTLPIVPSNSLASMSSHSMMLNLNLQFSCQQGAKTISQVFELIASSIKQQLDSRISRWQQSHSSPTWALGVAGDQRLANMSRPGDSQGDQQDPLANAGPNQANPANSYSLKPPLTTNLVNDLQADTIQSTIGKHNESSNAFIDQRSKYIGMVLLICGLLIGLTLATGACSVIRQRNDKSRSLKQRQTNSLKEMQPEQSSAFATDSSTQQSAMTSNIDECNQLSTQQDASNLLLIDRATASRHIIVDGSSGNQKSILTAINSGNYDCEQVPVGLESQGIVMQQHDYSPGRNNNHVCTVSDNQAENFVCWTADDNVANNEFLNCAMSLCRSQSSLSGANVISEHEQPIMLPILGTPLTSDFQTKVTFDQDCLNNSAIDNHYGGSSSETQVQSSGSSTAKKRVKISDPLATQRRSNGPRAYHYYANQQYVNQPQTLSKNNEMALYCPIHRNQSNSLLNVANTGYYIDDGATLVTAANNLELWNKDQFEPATTGRHYRRHNRYYQERASNSSFGMTCDVQLNQQQEQVVPNGLVVGPANANNSFYAKLDPPTGANLDSQNIQ